MVIVIANSFINLKFDSINYYKYLIIDFYIIITLGIFSTINVNSFIIIIAIIDIANFRITNNPTTITTTKIIDPITIIRVAIMIIIGGCINYYYYSANYITTITIT